MADNTYIKSDFTGFNFGYEFYNGKQIFKNAWTQNVIDDEVAKMRHSGLISDTDLAIVKFTFNNSFITARIARDLFMPDLTVEKVGEMLDKLEIPYNWVDVEKYVLFNIYCATQKESTMVKEIVESEVQRHEND